MLRSKPSVKIVFATVVALFATPSSSSFATMVEKLVATISHASLQILFSMAYCETCWPASRSRISRKRRSVKIDFVPVGTISVPSSSSVSVPTYSKVGTINSSQAPVKMPPMKPVCLSLPSPKRALSPSNRSPATIGRIESGQLSFRPQKTPHEGASFVLTFWFTPSAQKGAKQFAESTLASGLLHRPLLAIVPK